MRNSVNKTGTLKVWLLVGAMLSLAACSTTSVRVPAPVKEHNVNMGLKPTPAGYHKVQPGDTLAAISKLYSVDWRDIARWNNMSDPNRLEVGQLLAIEGAASKAPAKPPEEQAVVIVRPVTSGAPVEEKVKESVTAPEEPAAQTQPPAAGFRLIWPADGPVLADFDGNNNKGIGIGGKLGAPVVAAADGRVVYAGSGLRGYGNLVIIKHDDTFLTAYAHNQALLVKEDQVIKQGQRIAEMGNSESDVVKLHFEVRQMGKPVNPKTYLPVK